MDIGNPGIWKYADRLPAVSLSNRVTMGEGQVPLVKSAQIGAELGIPELYFKLESSNPTGSYKDRISALGVSLAKEQGKSACIGTSSGNAGASIAAYAARGGLKYRVYVQENIVTSKLEQILVYGAEAFKVRGMGISGAVGTQLFELVNERARSHNWEMLVTAFAYAPRAMEAVKTIAYELYEEMGGPDAVFVPVGGGGLYAGIHRGFQDLMRNGQLAHLPRMIACQSEGCANLVKGWERGLDKPLPGDSTSRISGIQLPSPPDANLVFAGLKESQGTGLSIPDPLTWSWQEQLAVKEGLFCEPASAISMAGLAQAVQNGQIRPHDRVVCIISGAGYKDATRAQMMVESRMKLPLYEVTEL
jgi:threonine synthase